MSDTLPATDPAVRIRRRAPMGMVTLRADLGSPRLAAAVETVTGCPIPAERRVVFASGGAAAWMAFDELMLFVAAGTGPAAVLELSTTLDGTHHLAVDVSDARVLFRLEGPDAREVLAKGAPVDLAPEAFTRGTFAAPASVRSRSLFGCPHRR